MERILRVDFQFFSRSMDRAREGVDLKLHQAGHLSAFEYLQNLYGEKSPSNIQLGARNALLELYESPNNLMETMQFFNLVVGPTAEQELRLKKLQPETEEKAGNVIGELFDHKIIQPDQMSREMNEQASRILSLVGDEPYGCIPGPHFFGVEFTKVGLSGMKRVVSQKDS